MKLFNICILVFLIQSINCYALQELPDSLFKKAEQGDARAQYRLGHRYYEGNGVTKDYTKAAFWIRKAAEQGNSNAQNDLGYCYKNGNGVPKDYSQAVYWYRKAADQGNDAGQNNLGLCYYGGEGVSKDYSQAVYWYRKAAEQGNSNAQYHLGICYKNGNGVPKDYSQALYWYRKAADQGNAYSQYHLGLCYDNGIGVSKDYSQAVYWYRKAADQGYAKAKSKLENINKNEISQKKNDVKKQEKSQVSSSKSKSSSPSTIIIGPNESSSELPNVINISIDKVIMTKKDNGVETKQRFDVSQLKIYRSGLIKIGNDNKMSRLDEFDIAVLYDLLPDVALFKNSDRPGVYFVFYSIDNLIEYYLISDVDNSFILTMYCKESESSKLKKIVQLVKQEKFIKK